MSSFVAEHASALADVRQAPGVRVVFRARGGSYAGANDQRVPSPSMVAGWAIRTRGEPDTYEALTLVEEEAPTLLFVPDTLGEVPPLGATATWEGRQYTVRDVLPLEPDGHPILARVVIAR